MSNCLKHNEWDKRKLALILYNVVPPKKTNMVLNIKSSQIIAY